MIYHIVAPIYLLFNFIQSKCYWLYPLYTRFLQAKFWSRPEKSFLIFSFQPPLEGTRFWMKPEFIFTTGCFSRNIYLWNIWWSVDPLINTALSSVDVIPTAGWYTGYWIQMSVFVVVFFDYKIKIINIKIIFSPRVIKYCNIKLSQIIDRLQ